MLTPRTWSLEGLEGEGGGGSLWKFRFDSTVQPNINTAAKAQKHKVNTNSFKTSVTFIEG
jgi:hypothetical protein